MRAPDSKLSWKKAGVRFGDSLRGQRITWCLLVAAQDGYSVVIALPEIDPDFTEKEVVLAFVKNGKPLDDVPSRDSR
jgi:hypothetical protein